MGGLLGDTGGCGREGGEWREKETLRMRDNNGEYGTSVPLNREDDCMETEGSISDSSPGGLVSRPEASERT